uniref:ABC transporter domain-containing protein n=1 Tax=Parascaris equorum TaxID=6256 RepID=A0A914RH63_PAREQ
MVEQLSGGELQRFAIAMCIVQQADVYMFDEPSSYLDVKQRLNAAKIIRELSMESPMVFDLAGDCIAFGVLVAKFGGKCR